MTCPFNFEEFVHRNTTLAKDLKGRNQKEKFLTPSCMYFKHRFPLFGSTKDNRIGNLLSLTDCLALIPPAI